jgi:hypothetical protein
MKSIISLGPRHVGSLVIHSPLVVTHIPERLHDLIIASAHHRCAYCLLNSQDVYLPDEVDYIRMFQTSV